MEEQLKRELMSEEEYIKALEDHRNKIIERVKSGELLFRSYFGVSKYKSSRRAIKRGHLSIFGDIYPKRPFGNTNTKMNNLKKEIYNGLRKSNDEKGVQ